jgi:cold shock CspA family protein
MRETGQLVDWNDERGFGFIRGAGGERYFVHIKSIEHIATRPFSGDRVDFEKGVDQRGRPRAIKVRILGANSAPSRQVRLRGEPAANQRPSICGSGWLWR